MFQLDEQQRVMAAMARSFADAKLAPTALAWDRSKHLPVDVLREAAALGLGGITVREASGSSGLGRLNGMLIFEALCLIEAGSGSDAAALRTHISTW